MKYSRNSLLLTAGLFAIAAAIVSMLGGLPTLQLNRRKSPELRTWNIAWQIRMFFSRTTPQKQRSSVTAWRTPIRSDAN